ncbi:MAG: MEDS domain-containing protein [Acidobacteria bacterium]|nr:MEDS domain-containing protein [Acidobacteriota bacterium]
METRTMLPQAPLFQFRHGDHVCVFYRTETALLEILTPYVAEGLRKGERCFCVQTNEVTRRLTVDLQFIGVNVDREIARGSLEFHSENDVYFESGAFDGDAMIRRLMRSVEESVKAGFTGFRSAGELTWASDEAHCKQVIGYEKMVEQCYPGKRAVGLCQYRMSAFEPTVLQALLEAHRMHLIEPDAASRFASIQIGHGLYATEIVADKIATHPNYYYVVQDRRPKQVIGWGIADDFESASTEAQELVRQLTV